MTELCKCTICELKEQIRAVWERLQTTIYGVRVNGERQIPDGQGIIDLSIADTSALESRLETAEQNIDDLDDDVEQIESEITALQSADTQLGQRMTSAEGRLTAAEADIDEHDQDIVRMDGELDDIDAAITDLQSGKQNTLTAGSGISISGDVISNTAQPDVTKQYVDNALAGKQPTGDYATNTALTNGLATKQNTLTAGTNITIVDDVISASGGGATYTAGSGIDITGNVISNTAQPDVTKQYVDNALSGKQNTLTAGSGIGISGNVISNTAQPDVTKQYVDNALAGKQDSGDYATNTALTNGLATKQNTLTAGSGISISGNVISNTAQPDVNKQYVDNALSGKQNTLTAGQGITISGNVISASGGGTLVISNVQGVISTIYSSSSYSDKSVYGIMFSSITWSLDSTLVGNKTGVLRLSYAYATGSDRYTHSYSRNLTNAELKSGSLTYIRFDSGGSAQSASYIANVKDVQFNIVVQ